MSAKIRAYDIVIIGAGASGLIAAILAKKNDLDVLLIEKNKENTNHGFAHYISAHTLSILEKVGIERSTLQALATPAKASKKMAYGVDLKTLYRHIDLDQDPDIAKTRESWGPMGAGLDIAYNKLEPYLKEEAKKQNIDILWQSSLENINTKENQITHQKGEEKTIVDYRYLLLCTGAKSSPIIEALFPKEEKKHWQSFLSIETEADLSPYVDIEAILYWLYQPSIQACMVGHQITSHQVWQVPLAQRQIKNDFKIEDIKKKLASLIGIEDTGEAIEKIKIKNFKVWHMTTANTYHMKNNNIFLLGDAANTMTPTGGLGLNSAIQDADNLIWKILIDIKNDNYSDLSSYESERKAIDNKRIEYSLENYENFLSFPKAIGLPVELKQLLDGIPLPETIDTIIDALPMQELINKYGVEGMKTFMSFMLSNKSPIKPSSIQKCLESNRKHFYSEKAHFKLKFPQERTWQGITVKEQNNEDSLTQELTELWVGSWVGYLQIKSKKHDQERHFISDQVQNNKWLLATINEKSHHYWSSASPISVFELQPYSIYEKSKLDEQKLALLVRPDGFGQKILAPKDQKWLIEMMKKIN